MHYLCLFLALSFCDVALGSEDLPHNDRGRIRKPSGIKPWHLRCMEFMHYQDALEYIWLSRALHQPFTKDECERFLNMLIENKEIPVVMHGKNPKNARVDKASLMDYMQKEGFGALVLLQLQQINRYDALTSQPEDR